MILGIFGIWGVGHIYVGKIGRGLVLLIFGIILEWVIGFFVIFGAMGIGYMYGSYSGIVGGLLGGIIIWLLIVLGIFIWQIYDSYNLAKYYNNYVQQYKKAPW